MDNGKLSSGRKGFTEDSVLDHFLEDSAWTGDRGTLGTVLELLDKRRTERRQALGEKAGKSRRRGLRRVSRRGVELPRKGT